MSTRALSIAHVASEMAPLVKVGGLADVVGALAREQAAAGHRVTVVLPRYAGLRRPAGVVARAEVPIEVPWGMGRERAEVERLETADGVTVLLIGHSGERRFFDRPGIYDDPRTGEGYPDSAERFLYFSRAATLALERAGTPLDVLHAHDHPTAWAPCFARTHHAGSPAFANAATVFTIHNLGYQGIHDFWVLGLAGFGLEHFHPGGPFEFWGRVNFMKVGLAFADAVTTVSPRYAREIQSGGESGLGLEGVLRRRGGDLTGILNGIDLAVWDPAHDPHLAQTYDADHLEHRQACRERLREECGFAAKPAWPLVGMISRLAEQKGFDLIEQAEKELMRLEARFVILGSGQARYQELLRRLATTHRDRVCFREGYDETFAHRIEGGADLFLMPSRYEPCGLNQMYSQRYGAAPVVRATGGLADTVTEFDPLTRRGDGFRFDAFESTEMLASLRRALAIHRQPELWRVLQRNGMALDRSWRTSAARYERVYRATQAKVAAAGPPTLESVRALLELRAGV